MLIPINTQTRFIAVETVRSAPTFQTQPGVYMEGAPTAPGAQPKFEWANLSCNHTPRRLEWFS